MSLELVTAQEAADHLRLSINDSGGGDDANWLAIFIPAISESVAGWLKDSWRLYVPEIDSSGFPVIDSSGEQVPADPPVARPVVKAAVLLELSNVYRYREGEGQDNVVPDAAGYGYALNKASTALLSSLRKSTVA